VYRDFLYAEQYRENIYRFSILSTLHEVMYSDCLHALEYKDRITDVFSFQYYIYRILENVCPLCILLGVNSRDVLHAVQYRELCADTLFMP
jgi:hypothetical protein